MLCRQVAAFTVHRPQQQQRRMQFKQACCSAGRAGLPQLVCSGPAGPAGPTCLGCGWASAPCTPEQPAFLSKQTAGLQLGRDTTQAPLPAHSAEQPPRQGDSRAVMPSRAGAARLAQHAASRHPRSRLQQGQDAPQVCGRCAAGGRLALQERLLRARRRCAPQSHQALIG